jgi:hypothetical protein
MTTEIRSISGTPIGHQPEPIAQQLGGPIGPASQHSIPAPHAAAVPAGGLCAYRNGVKAKEGATNG